MRMQRLKPRIAPIVLLVLVSLLLAAQGEKTYASPPPPDRGSPGRQLYFAGILWGVRGEYGSPGPNEFSDKTDSVWVDELGRLHLKVRKWQDKWYAAEIFSTVRTRYGLHSFTVEKANPTLDNIDPNLVLGLFLYKTGCGEGCEDELDIEFSRWRRAGVYRNAQYVAQPADVYKNLYPFRLADVDTMSTHLIDWQDDRVYFASHRGGSAGSAESLLQEWTYTGEYIPEVDEDVLVVIDFWMDGGAPPRNGLEDEVIITDLGIPNICVPVRQLACGERLGGQTTGPGARDQVDTYVNWPFAESGPEIAYRFTAPLTGEASFSVTGSRVGHDVFVLAEANQTCAGYHAITAGDQTAVVDITAGHTYYVVVDSKTDQGGAFTLTADCTVPPPAPFSLK